MSSRRSMSVMSAAIYVVGATWGIAAARGDGDATAPPPTVAAPVHFGTTLLRQGQGVEGVAFSPDGKLLASCGWDDAIRLWNVADGELVRQLKTDEGDGTFSVAFSPDGNRLASVGESGLVRIWDLTTGESVWKVLGHTDDLGDGRKFGTRTFGVAFSTDGARLATGGSDPRVRLWDVATGKQLQEFDLKDEQEVDARPVAFSPDGSRLASASSDGTLFIWNLHDGTEARVVPDAHERDVVSLLFSKDGKTLVSSGQRLVSTGAHTASSVSEIRVWDIATGDRLQDFATSSDLSGAATLVLSQDGATLISAHFDRIVLWDVESRLPKRSIKLPGAQLGGRSHGLAISPDGRLLASKGAWRERNKVWLWDLAARQELFPQEEAHAAGVLAVRFSPDGTRMATGGTDNTVRLWDAATGQHLRLVDSGLGWVRFVEFSPDGRRLYLGRETHGPGIEGFQGEVLAYDLAEGNRLWQLDVPDRVMCGALSPDGKSVAVALGLQQLFLAGGPAPPARQVIVCNAESGTRLAECSAGASSLLFSRDDANLYLAGDDGRVQRWNWHDGGAPQPLDVPAPKAGFVQSRAAAFAPSASCLAVAGLKRHDRGAMGELRFLQILEEAPNWKKQWVQLYPSTIAVSPDEKSIAAFLKPRTAASEIARLTVWSLAKGDELGSMELPDQSVRSLAFSADGKRLAAGMELGDAIVWDVRSNFANNRQLVRVDRIAAKFVSG